MIVKKGGNRGLRLTTWNEIFLWEKTLMCRHIRPFVPALSQRYMCALHTHRPHQVSYWYLANCEILLSIHLCRVQSQSSRNSQLMSSAIISKQLALTHTVSAVDRLVHTFTPVAQTHTHRQQASTNTTGTHSLSQVVHVKHTHYSHVHMCSHI